MHESSHVKTMKSIVEIVPGGQLGCYEYLKWCTEVANIVSMCVKSPKQTQHHAACAHPDTRHTRTGSCTHMHRLYAFAYAYTYRHRHRRKHGRWFWYDPLNLKMRYTRKGVKSISMFTGVHRMPATARDDIMYSPSLRPVCKLRIRKLRTYASKLPM